jgi:tetratricopeptide (TPR) repeat protein
MKILPISFIVLAMLTLNSRVSAQTNDDWKKNVDQLINAEKFTDARNELLKQKNSFEALWRLSRLEVFEADRHTNSEKKLEGYKKAFDMAEKTIALAPRESHGYLRKASASGRMALYKGVLEAREYVIMVKENAEKAIALNTGGAEIQAWAHYVLGRAHLKLSDTPGVIRKTIGLGWGNIKDAEKNLLKAITLKPDSVLIWAEIAKLYNKQNRSADAQNAIQKAKSLPVKEPTDKEGKEELQKIK